MTCTNIWEEDGHTRLIIREMTASEKSEKELKAKIKEIEETFGIMLTGEVQSYEYDTGGFGVQKSNGISGSKNRC